VKDGLVTVNTFSQFMGAGVFGPAGKTMPPAGRRKRLFDGKSFTGWEGDTKKTWRIENGALVGGSLQETVPHLYKPATHISGERRRSAALQSNCLQTYWARCPRSG